MEYENDFASRLRYAMKIKGKKSVDVCRATGLSSALISQYLSGKFEPKNDKAYIIANYLGVNAAWLLGWENDPFCNSGVPDLTEIPMENVVFDDYFPLHYSSNLSAGSFEDLLQAEPDSVVYVPIVFQGRRKRLHAFKVNGTSMNNVIEDGSIVVAEDTADGGVNFQDGTIVVAFLDGKATVKRLYRTGDHVTLMPDSSDKSHMPITVTPDQQLYIIGRVIWHMNPDNIAELRY